MVKNSQIINLLNKCKEYGLTNSELEKIKKAAVFADKKHQGQFRKSGEPYIIHPLKTAEILLWWNMDVKTIITGILHDVLEDTNTSDEEIKKEFGPEIYSLVNYVTKVNVFSKENRGDIDKQKRESDYLIQVLLSMSHDLRAIIVKLADRYHNMSTIEYLPIDKQKKIAFETFNIYAKVSGRLGMYRLKTNLLDMSFKILNPIEYEDTKQKIDSVTKSYEHTWNKITEKIQGILDSYSIKYEIKTRIKGIYSTWEKIQRGYNIKDIHDIYAIRLITENNLDCYKILGLIHLNFVFINKAFKDYISLPKFNFYQSIHTTIVHNQTLLEIQIRTQKMDFIAENGIASHWKYKESNLSNNFSANNFFIEEINNLSDKSLSNITKITNDIVFVVTVLNDSQTYTVNNKTRCIDLAYRFNEELFKHLDSVVVNGQVSNLDALLQPHDVIKFNYSKDVLINRKWIKYTNFEGTIKAIKDILNKELSEIIVYENEFLKLVKEKLKNNYIGDDQALLRIKKYTGMDRIQNLLDCVSPEIYNNPEFWKLFDKRRQIRRKAFRLLSEKSIVKIKKHKEFYFDKIDGLYFSDLQFPKCCNKLPGIDVIGIIDKDGVMQVHSYNCANLNKIKGKVKKYPLTWNEAMLINKPRKFCYTFNFSAIWTPSIGNIVATKLKKYNNLINEINVRKNKDKRMCEVNITVYTSHINSIKAAFDELNQEINVKTNLIFNQS